jgi:hypothetical protein
LKEHGGRRVADLQWERLKEHIWGEEGEEGGLLFLPYATKRRRLFGIFFNFYYNMGILVILTPKTTSFWDFRPFSRFHLMEGAIL